MADVPLQVISENSTSERRITPSWSITQLKRKLEPITGIPPSSQRISLKTASKKSIPIEAADEDVVLLSNFPLSAYAELHVSKLVPIDALGWAVIELVIAVAVLYFVDTCHLTSRLNMLACALSTIMHSCK